MAVMTAVNVEERARQSRGISNDAILNMVVRALQKRRISGGCVVDVGCGAGNLYTHLGSGFARYIGVDAVKYADFPAQAEFCHLDLDTGRISLPDASADVVAAVEVIEHLENPREFMRKLVRLAKPGGWIIVTTPNQLSLLSLLTLIVKQRFQAFQDVQYPAHLTALLEIDLRRIAQECGLQEIAIDYSGSGRIPGTSWHYPRPLSRGFPRLLSENILLMARKTDSR
jgi:2-polyprenyl-3-methyl-5-hydroxy-6-metoxy-1,4-benzoquinol methylase